MPTFLISFHNEHGICGETIVAANEDQARERWADIHETGQIEKSAAGDLMVSLFCG